jgi:hypothetical protein
MYLMEVGNLLFVMMVVVDGALLVAFSFCGVVTTCARDALLFFAFDFRLIRDWDISDSVDSLF